jgi:hypothetical protein
MMQAAANKYAPMELGLTKRRSCCNEGIIGCSGFFLAAVQEAQERFATAILDLSGRI